MIVYTKATGLIPQAASLEAPIKMIIENESNIQARKNYVLDRLFNVEKSNRFGETLVTETEFNLFKPAEEGAAAEQDNIRKLTSKFVEHIQYMKEFNISAEMMEDAGYGIATSAKRRIENFTRAYYRTMNNIAAYAITRAYQPTFTYNGAELDLTSPDGLSVFNNKHRWGTTGTSSGIFSNKFSGNIFQTGIESNRILDIDLLEERINYLAAHIRKAPDENGEAMGYEADTIILPANQPKAEALIKRICYSEGKVNTNLNDVNLNYGRWNIIVLPQWIANNPAFIMMSSEANKNLGGNMFFNRVPLTVTNWIDPHTDNYVWHGICRFGVGFGTYKHMLYAEDMYEESEDYTYMD